MDRSFWLLAFLVTTSLAGCATTPEADKGEDATFLAFRLTGTITGTDANNTRINVACDPMKTYMINDTEKSILYIEGALTLPPVPTMVLMTWVNVHHPAASPCVGFWDMPGFNELEGAVVFDAEPFHWSKEFTREGDVLRVDLDHVAPRGTRTYVVNQTQGGIHYQGYLRLENLGLWPVSGIEAFATSQEFYDRIAP